MMSPVKIAIMGAGPSGIYAAEALLKQAPGEVAIDIFDRLPSPYGLVRYGVAPDHPKIKSVTRVLQRVLEDPSVRFLGAVEFGADVTRARLRDTYDAVVYATGAAADRPLGILGEELPGCHPAADFVAWYSGHPDAQLPVALDQIDSVAVIGVGNVALDVARILVKSVDDLTSTDMPTEVLDQLRTSTVKNVHIIGRRSPEFAKFTTKELRELGEFPQVAVSVEQDEVTADVDPELERTPAANMAVLRDWADTPPAPDGSRHLSLRFGLEPVEVLGDGKVEGLRCERTTTAADGTTSGTGEFEVLPVQCVLRAIGYRGLALLDVPFDEDRGIVRNVLGRVVDGTGTPTGGEYVAGWLKRGPTGVIGTNKSDAAETVRSLLEDLEAGVITRGQHSGVDILSLLDGQTVTYDGWLNINAEELSRGSSEGRDRVKVSDWATLRRLSRRSDGSG